MKGSSYEQRFKMAKWKIPVAMVMFLMMNMKTAQEEVFGYGSF